MNLFFTRAALVLLFTPAVFAASNTDLSVRGSITPSACSPLISGGGMVDFGKMSAKSLNAEQHTSLPNQSMQLSVRCEAPTFFTLSTIDNRAGTSANHDRWHGLGMTPNDEKLGGSAFHLYTPVADGVAVRIGPVRGDWPDENWKGWWGDNPPYHVPAFVLTHHARPPIEMEGGTTFYFVTGGIHEALDRAREAAAGKDVRIGGGANTIQQYLRDGLIDELHIAISPVLLGRGESLFGGVDLRGLGYECVESVASEKATHVVLRRKGHPDA